MTELCRRLFRLLIRVSNPPRCAYCRYPLLTCVNHAPAIWLSHVFIVTCRFLRRFRRPDRLVTRPGRRPDTRPGTRRESRPHTCGRRMATPSRVRTFSVWTSARICSWHAGKTMLFIANADRCISNGVARMILIWACAGGLASGQCAT